MDEMDDNLKRCPFCGTLAMVDEVKTVSWRGGQSKPMTRYIAQCLIQSCPGHHGKAYTSKQKAIDKWNNRVPATFMDDDECLAKLRAIRDIVNSRK